MSEDLRIEDIRPTRAQWAEVEKSAGRMKMLRALPDVPHEVKEGIKIFQDAVEHRDWPRTLSSFEYLWEQTQRWFNDDTQA